ncbi:MAG: hypothetical protein WAW17_01260, partial [Rhodococcus sp. (in: high G+C Gram-positive bacteria)]|uniref:hypothetical protein n=1 Tax=Rhodococcus sp. TaxID=1831 RepID=UPI003BB2065D
DSPEARAAYITRMYRGSPACSAAAEHWAEAVDMLADPPALADRSEWPVLSPVQEAALRDRITCGTGMADRVLALDDGEVVDEDHISYLTEPWGQIPAGTPVLRRTTSLAVLFCFFDDVTIAPENPDIVRPVVSVVSSAGTTAGGAEDAEIAAEGHLAVLPLGFGIEEIALEIAKALLEKLASFAIESVMGTSVPDYFGEVYREIRSIVSEEIDAHMIRELTDEFAGAQDWNNRHYLPLKEGGASADELVKEMSAKETEFYFALAKLKDAKVAQVALGEFLIGASMHLAFIQELVNVSGAPNWKIELSKNAVADADHAEATWRAVVQARSDRIKVQPDGDCVPVNGYSKCTYYWTSYDDVTDTWGRKFVYTAMDKDQEKAAKTKAEKDAEHRRAAAVEDLRVKLGKPEETIAAWRNLV